MRYLFHKLSIYEYANELLITVKSHRSNHKFHINDGRVDVTVPSELFHVDSTSVNGTYNSGWALKPGTARIQAVLKGVVTSRGTEYPLRDKVSTEEDMLIYSRMEIHPKTVVLPWDPRIRSRFDSLEKLNFSYLICNLVLQLHFVINLTYTLFIVV